MKEGWEYKKLEDICSKGSSNISLNKIEDNNGEFSLYGASGLVKGIDFYHQSQQYIGIVKDGSGVGRVNIYPPKTSLVGTMQYIFPKKGCEIGYLKYLLQGLHLDNFKTGAAIPHIYFKDYGKCVVPIPTITEQQQIVEELDLLSSIIEKKKAQIKELDNLAQSLFYEMFGESSNWECKQLKEITTKMGSGATPRGGNQSYKEDGVSLIRSLNVHNGHFKYDDLAHIDEQQASQLDNVTIKENDVLLNITGASVARCCIVPTDILPARVNQHVSILRVKETLLNSTYLCHCLISPNSQAELLIMSKSNAATREALPKATLEKYLVPIPPLDLQNQFAEKVQAIEHQKELIKQSIKEVETLFNSRMDYYFN